MLAGNNDMQERTDQELMLERIETCAAEIKGSSRRGVTRAPCRKNKDQDNSKMQARIAKEAISQGPGPRRERAMYQKIGSGHAANSSGFYQLPSASSRTLDWTVPAVH